MSLASGTGLCVTSAYDCGCSAVVLSKFGGAGVGNQGSRAVSEGMAEHAQVGVVPARGRHAVGGELVEIQSTGWCAQLRQGETHWPAAPPWSAPISLATQGVAVVVQRVLCVGASGGDGVDVGGVGWCLRPGRETRPTAHSRCGGGGTRVPIQQQQVLRGQSHYATFAAVTPSAVNTSVAAWLMATLMSSSHRLARNTSACPLVSVAPLPGPDAFTYGRFSPPRAPIRTPQQQAAIHQAQLVDELRRGHQGHEA
ncbi:hypothetical protein F5883DRAFT_575603 [Diaporthe sp. PMI_573]|nr:hypothetical protein F5883DRAFT_575603 [Diaporthaceae sp. PMI_573]